MPEYDINDMDVRKKIIRYFVNSPRNRLQNLTENGRVFVRKNPCFVRPTRTFITRSGYGRVQTNVKCTPPARDTTKYNNYYL